MTVHHRYSFKGLAMTQGDVVCRKVSAQALGLRFERFNRSHDVFSKYRLALRVVPPLRPAGENHH